jgi:uncharacterized protein (TIGR03067 family)
MKLISIGSVALSLMLLAAGLGRDSRVVAQPDKKSPLDGRWQVTRQEERGGLVPPIVSKRLSMVIEEGEMGWYIGNPAPNLTATITIDEEKKTVDAEITRGSFIGKKMLGIYRFSKDTMEMCWGEIGTERRPTKFTTKPGAGGGFNYTVYKREKPVDDKPRSEAPPPPTREPLDGRWQVTRQEERGGLVPPIVSKRLSMVIEDGEMGWYIGNPAPNLTATITLNEEKKTVDAEITRGSFYGKKMLGIYRLNKDTLEMCWGEIGTDKRPSKFTTKPGAGGGFNYTTYRREKPIDDKPGPEERRQAKPPPDPTTKPTPAGQRPRLADLKFTLPKGWEATYRDASNRWSISQGFTPSVDARWALAKNYPRDLDDYVARLQKNGDHFAYGLYWTGVTEKAKLPDGLFVVGKVKLQGDKESKRIGFSIIRDLGGDKIIFESFSTYYDDAKLLKEAIDICKSAKF